MTMNKKKTSTPPAAAAPAPTPVAPEAQPQAGTAPASPPPITVADIKTMVAIINTSTQRGSFRANELTQVGQLHDKLVLFLQFLEGANGTQSEAEPAAEGA